MWYRPAVTTEEAQAFLAVLNHGRFQPAAEDLGVAQSTVSRRVRSLERQVGRQLLERRTGRRCVPTASGRALADALPAVLQAMDRAAQACRG